MELDSSHLSTLLLPYARALEFPSFKGALTVSKMSKYGVFSSPYFAVFSLRYRKTPYLDTSHAVSVLLKETTHMCMLLTHPKMVKSYLSNNIYPNNLFALNNLLSYILYLPSYI